MYQRCKRSSFRKQTVGNSYQEIILKIITTLLLNCRYCFWCHFFFCAFSIALMFSRHLDTWADFLFITFYIMLVAVVLHCQKIMIVCFIVTACTYIIITVNCWWSRLRSLLQHDNMIQFFFAHVFRALLSFFYFYHLSCHLSCIKEYSTEKSKKGINIEMVRYWRRECNYNFCFVATFFACWLSIVDLSKMMEPTNRLLTKTLLVIVT